MSPVLGLRGGLPLLLILWSGACAPPPEEIPGAMTTLPGSGTDPTADGGSETGGAVCGNGELEDGEACDEGPDNGQAMNQCRADCQLNECGDGYVGPGELCDDGNDDPDDECSNACGPTSCGDGIVMPPEECDQGAANSETGSCLPSCLVATCGDGFVQEGEEECDSDDFGGQTCDDFAPEGSQTSGGALVCNGCVIDAVQCTFCGDGVLEGGEVCDGAQFGGLTCADYPPNTSGSLSCGADCMPDPAGCHYCGNGQVDPGEQCDSNVLGHANCAAFDPGTYDGGPLTCVNASCTYDTSACYFCGDGQLDPGEQCDIIDFGGQTCSSVDPIYGDSNPLLCTFSCTIDTILCCLAGGQSCEDSGDCCSGSCANNMCDFS